MPRHRSRSPRRPGSRSWTRLRRPRLDLLPLFYGRTLYLPPTPAVRRGQGADYDNAHPLIGALRPFRRRLHVQQVVVGLARVICLAVLVAALTIALGALGLTAGLARPVVPLASAAAVLLSGLALLIARGPSSAQIARAIDTRLGLSQQVGSALEVGAGPDAAYYAGRGPAGQQGQGLWIELCRRAEATLAVTEPARVLPWPSLHRERTALAGLAVGLGVAIAVASTVPDRPLGASSATGALHGVNVRRSVASMHPGRPAGRAVPLPLHLLSASSIVQPGAAGPHLVSRTGGRPRGGNAQTQGNAPAATGPHLQVAGAASHGAGGRSGSGRTGTQRVGTAPGGAPGRQGTRPGAGTQPGTAHLSAGQNASRAGVIGTQQQVTTGNATTGGAQGQQGSAGRRTRDGRTGAGRGGTNGTGRGGAHSANRNGSGAGRQSHAGTNGGPHGKQGQGADQSGDRLANAAGTSPDGRGAASARGNSGGVTGDPRMQRGRPGSGSGQDTGSNGAPAAGGHGVAQLGNGGMLTIDATGNHGGQVVFSVGPEQRSPGQGSSSGGASLAPVSSDVPGYVAPDSNLVSPGARDAVRGYFNPRDGQ